MALLFRLPFLLLELLLRRLFGRDEDQHVYAVAPDAPPAPATAPPATAPPAFTGASPNGAPPPTADEAIQRRVDREAADVANPHPGPPTPLRPISDTGHLDTEATVVESFGDPDDVGSTITVDEPWPGYDDDTAGAIVARLRDADGATKGVVALYEGAHKARKTVLKAAG